MYSISEFAKLINVTPQTLRNWEKNKKLIPIKLNSGHRRYSEEHFNKIKNIIKNDNKLNVIYCRESTRQQKESLNNQLTKIKEFCISKGYVIDKVITDFSGALNYNRKGIYEILNLISKNKVNKLIIYYKDRLVRFGFEIFMHLSKIHGFEIIVIDDSETEKSKEKEFADDLISIIHHFSMKLYGSRSYKKKIKNAENDINKIKNEI
jgi:predicted site-specific integrase-resolvase